MIYLAVLVICSGKHKNAYEREAKKLWTTFMHSHPQVWCRFLEGDGESETDDGTTLTVDVEDSVYPGILAKTLKGFEKVLRDVPQCTHILRTNLSSVFAWDRCIRFITANQHCPVIAPITFGEFPSGCGMILRKDVIERLVHSTIDIREHNDDVVIGRTLGRIGYGSGSWLHKDFVLLLNSSDDSSLFNPPDVYHIRCKLFGSDEPDVRVRIEIPRMAAIIDQLKYLN